METIERNESDSEKENSTELPEQEGELEDTIALTPEQEEEKRKKEEN